MNDAQDEILDRIDLILLELKDISSSLQTLVLALTEEEEVH